MAGATSGNTKASLLTGPRNAMESCHLTPDQDSGHMAQDPLDSFKSQPRGRHAANEQETKSAGRQTHGGPYFSRAFGPKESLAFREMEQHYSKFDTCYGSDIAFVVDNVSGTRPSQAQYDVNAHLESLRQPVYLLSGSQPPMV